MRCKVSSQDRQTATLQAGRVTAGFSRDIRHTIGTLGTHGKAKQVTVVKRLPKQPKWLPALDLDLKIQELLVSSSFLKLVRNMCVWLVATVPVISHCCWKFLVSSSIGMIEGPGSDILKNVLLRGKNGGQVR